MGGMEYTCLLFGKATAPQPQGPIKCPAGAKPAAVDFKNPLNEKCEFQVTFDNPNFSLASKLPGPLDPGKVTALQIKYDASEKLGLSKVTWNSHFSLRGFLKSTAAG